jgi:hypothetical protein
VRKYQIKRYYIDEEVLLLKANGGNKKTKAGGVVVMSQRAMTCRTCFAVIGQNHFDNHTKTHFSRPLMGEQK